MRILVKAKRQQALEFVLDDAAELAISQIIKFLGARTSAADAVRRAIGTELYLLKQVREKHAKVFVESWEGRIEVDLLGGTK